MLLKVQSSKKQQLLEITQMVQKALESEGVLEGLVAVFVPHTTAAVTINENTDPDVCWDLLQGLDRIFPPQGDYRHWEGNAHAHIKASLVGSSCLVAVEKGQLQLGRWQGIFFCEFDGPRSRQVYLKLVQG